ncbi:MAG: hypothetical protein ABL918_11315 [Chakrabartia sp.]
MRQRRQQRLVTLAAYADRCILCDAPFAHLINALTQFLHDFILLNRV